MSFVCIIEDILMQNQSPPSLMLIQSHLTISCKLNLHGLCSYIVNKLLQTTHRLNSNIHKCTTQYGQGFLNRRGYLVSTLMAPSLISTDCTTTVHICNIFVSAITWFFCPLPHSKISGLVNLSSSLFTSPSISAPGLTFNSTPPSHPASQSLWSSFLVSALVISSSVPHFYSDSQRVSTSY